MEKRKQTKSKQAENKIFWHGKVRKRMKIRRKMVIKSKKKMIALLVSAVLVLSLTGGGIIWSKANTQSQSSETAPVMEGTVQKGNLDLTVSATGTTTGTTSYQPYELKLSEGGLEVETVLAEAGDTVKEGDPLFTLTKESVEETKKTLEEAAAQYKEELSLAQIAYEEAIQEAETEYQRNLSLVSTASLEYQDALESYEANVATQKKQLEQAKTVIQEYPAKISSYQEKKAEKEKKSKELQQQMNSQKKLATSAKTAMDKAQKAYEKAQEEYSDMEAVSNYLSGYSADSGNAAIVSLKETAESEKAEKSSALQKAKQAYETAKKSYENKETKYTKLTQQKEKYDNAAEEYKEKISSSESALKEAKANLTLYQSKYYSALSEQALGKVSAAKTYAENMQQYQNASATYQSAVKEAKSALREVKDQYTSAKEQKKIFSSLAAGQKICAGQDGTVNVMDYQAGDILSSGVPIAGYQDSSVINIEVSVDQKDIHYIEVGQEVNVSLTSVRGQMTGTVSSIETETSSESVSSVTYTVIVTLDNSQGMIGMNETAAVSFPKGSIENVLYVPVSAVDTKGGKSLVTIKQEDGSTKQVAVTTGENNGQYIVIKNGLEEGDTYVVEMES